MFGRGFGPWELILVLLIALIIFGPGKLPEMGKALGRSLREFKKATKDLTSEITEAVEDGGDDDKAEAKSS